MNGIRNVVAFLEHEVLLCKAGLHPDQLDNLTEQLDRARLESWRQFQESLNAHQKEVNRHLKEVQKYCTQQDPESCLVARGPDEWMDGHGNWHTQDCEARPDL